MSSGLAMKSYHQSLRRNKVVGSSVFFEEVVVMAGVLRALRRLLAVLDEYAKVKPKKATLFRPSLLWAGTWMNGMAGSLVMGN